MTHRARRPPRAGLITLLAGGATAVVLILSAASAPSGAAQSRAASAPSAAIVSGRMSTTKAASAPTITAVKALTPLNAKPGSVATAKPGCSAYDATKAVLEPPVGMYWILTAVPEGATGVGIPAALGQIAAGTVALADGLDAASKCLD